MNNTLATTPNDLYKLLAKKIGSFGFVREKLGKARAELKTLPENMSQIQPTDEALENAVCDFMFNLPIAAGHYSAVIGALSKMEASDLSEIDRILGELVSCAKSNV